MQRTKQISLFLLLVIFLLNVFSINASNNPEVYFKFNKYSYEKDERVVLEFYVSNYLYFYECDLDLQYNDNFSLPIEINEETVDLSNIDFSNTDLGDLMSLLMAKVIEEKINSGDYDTSVNLYIEFKALENISNIYDYFSISNNPDDLVNGKTNFVLVVNSNNGYTVNYDLIDVTPPALTDINNFYIKSENIDNFILPTVNVVDNFDDTIIHTESYYKKDKVNQLTGLESMKKELRTEGVFYIKYNAVDSSNNSMDEVSVKVSIDDDLPIIIGVKNATYMKGSAMPSWLSNVQAIDNQDGDITENIKVFSSIVNMNETGNYTVIYEVSDGAGNKRVVNKEVRIIEPKSYEPSMNIILNGESQVFVEYKSTYIEEGVTVIDNGAKDIDVLITGSVDTSVLGTYWITYTATSENSLMSVKRKINVVDSTPPKIEFNDSTEIYLEIGSEYIDPGFTVTDNYDLEIDNETVIIEGDINTSRISTQKINYTVKDGHGNKKTYIKTIYIVFDNTPPTVELKGNKIEYIEVGKMYLDKGIKIEDKTQTKFIVSENVDTSKAGIYKVKYTVTDSSGNTTEIEREVHVLSPIVRKIEVNINNGFRNYDIPLNSILNKIDGTNIFYIVNYNANIPHYTNESWKEFDGYLDLAVNKKDMFIHIMLINENGDFEIFSTTLPYEDTESIKSESILVTTNGKDKARRVNKAIEEDLILSKEIIKFQSNEDGTLVVFDLRDQFEFNEMKVYYRVKQSQASTLMMNVSASSKWEELIVYSGEVEYIFVEDNSELEFKTELTYNDQTKEIESSEFIVASNNGTISVDLITESNNTGIYIGVIIGMIIIFISGYLLIKFKNLKGSQT